MIAHEYPGPLTKFFSHGLAGAVSLSRVAGDQHFPSDVLAGAAMGWLMARDIYHKHHDPAFPGGSWGAPPSDIGGGLAGYHNIASVYVP